MMQDHAGSDRTVEELPSPAVSVAHWPPAYPVPGSIFGSEPLPATSGIDLDSIADLRQDHAWTIRDVAIIVKEYLFIVMISSCF